jgi:hypothetical protein
VSDNMDLFSQQPLQACEKDFEFFHDEAKHHDGNPGTHPGKIGSFVCGMVTVAVYHVLLGFTAVLLRVCARQAAGLPVASIDCESK